MIRYECDRCGTPLGANDPRRFIVKMEVYAATGSIDLGEADDDGRGLSEAIEALSGADPDAVEDQTYRCLRFDLCDTCHKRVLSNPLG